MLKVNRIDCNGGLASIHLPTGRVALISSKYVSLVKKHRWGWNGRYVQATPRSGRIYLHRLIMGVADDPTVEIDHRNRNTLDCRKFNLRRCTRSENMHNTRPRRSSTGYRGVQPVPGGRFIARLGADNQKINLGTFDTAEEAARVYDYAAKKRFGSYATLNER